MIFQKISKNLIFILEINFYPTLAFGLMAWSEEIWKIPTQTNLEFQTATNKLVLLTATSLVGVGVTVVKEKHPSKFPSALISESIIKAKAYLQHWK